MSTPKMLSFPGIFRSNRLTQRGRAAKFMTVTTSHSIQNPGGNLMGISNLNLGSMLRRSAHKHPQKVALVSHEGVGQTYLQLETLSNRVARAFKKLGIKKGDHVAVLSLNCIEELIAFFGIFKLGAVAVPINVRLAAPEMKWIIEHSDATFLIYSKGFEARVVELRPGLKKIEHYILIGEDPPENTLCFKDVLEPGDEDAPQTEVLGDDEAFLLYTAGTTGRTKRGFIDT